MVYSPVPRQTIVDSLLHIRELHRRVLPSTEREVLAYERRESLTRDLLSNLHRTSEHPTLNMLLDVAEICSLTLDGAHKLFGYNLEALRDFDLKLNGSLTHPLESYAFNRHLPVDLPARLASHETFRVDARLRDLVLEWQKDAPIRAIDQDGWKKPGAFYVHVGTEDSLGSSLPAGSMALVEPIDASEAAEPSPRAIYLLQFPNGYRCSHCVVGFGKLRPITRGDLYLGKREYRYPGEVRIAGRIRMFAVGLPLPEYSLTSLRPSTRGAPLILPWEHRSRDQLLSAESARFPRSPAERASLRQALQNVFHARISDRTERRYRSPTSSDPHVNALLHLTIANAARYTDALRTGGSWSSDQGRFSLDVLLNSRSMAEAAEADREARLPHPREVWEARRKEFGEWPPLLSMKFPHLQQLDGRVVRLAHGSSLKGIEPRIREGSWLLLEPVTSIPEVSTSKASIGWSRPIYLLRRGIEMVCGYVDRDSDKLAFFADSNSGPRETIPINSLSQLSRVTGVAVPV